MTPWDLAKSGSEHGEQRALFAWCNMAERYGLYCANDLRSYVVLGRAENAVKQNISTPIPQLHWIHAIKNAEKGGAIRGTMAKAEGVKAGVADVFLPVSTIHIDHSYIIARVTGYAGLYIEMKKLKAGVQSAEQKEFADYCNSAGYKYVLCKGWIEAKDAIIEYLGVG